MVQRVIGEMHTQHDRFRILIECFAKTFILDWVISKNILLSREFKASKAIRKQSYGCRFSAKSRAGEMLF
ncbi:MAG TPA: hypothetical protein DCS30_20240 [Rhizobiales bacterium]|nr:hypothetical protein [Hyphomicrobiales bacterium]